MHDGKQRNAFCSITYLFYGMRCRPPFGLPINHINQPGTYNAARHSREHRQQGIYVGRGQRRFRCRLILPPPPQSQQRESTSSMMIKIFQHEKGSSTAWHLPSPVSMFTFDGQVEEWISVWDISIFNSSIGPRLHVFSYHAINLFIKSLCQPSLPLSESFFFRCSLLLTQADRRRGDKGYILTIY